MGIMDMRILITVVSFVIFLLIVFWAYSSRQKKRFDEAANLPFADEQMQRRTVQENESGQQNESESGSESSTTTDPSPERDALNQEKTHG